MPRAPADTTPKRDPRLRPLKPAVVDDFGWVEPVKRPAPAPAEYNIHGNTTKPSFWKMIKQALLAHRVQYIQGVTLSRIQKYIVTNWPVDLNTYRRLTRVALKRALEDGKLETVEGRSTGYRLAPSERPKAKKAQKASQKPATTATRKPRKRASADSEEEPPVKKRKAPANREAPPAKKATKKATGAKKSAVRRTGANQEEGTGEGKWIWQYQDGGWHDYDPAASDEVEKTYQLYEKEKATGRIIDVRAVRSGAWAYQIDFRQFTQQNIQHAAHTIRSIRRIWRAAR